MEVWDKDRFFSPYSRLMPKCTLSPTRSSQQQRLKRNVPWQPKVLLGPTQWRLWRKRRNNQSFHDRISSEELNIEFRINGCQKIDVLIKTKHDKRPRSRSADFLAVTFLLGRNPHMIWGPNVLLTQRAKTLNLLRLDCMNSLLILYWASHPARCLSNKR